MPHRSAEPPCRQGGDRAGCIPGIPFTSFRPTYIYGPGNYNPIERWFFDRILHNRPVPLPGDGSTITQLGHVDDLAEAMARSIDVEAATNRIYNCSGKQGITFKGLIQAAAMACGRDPKRGHAQL